MDFTAACAVWIHGVCPSLTVRETETGLSVAGAGLRQAARHDEIPLCELASTVEFRNGNAFQWACGSVGIRRGSQDRAAEIALQDGVAAVTGDPSNSRSIAARGVE